MNRPMTRVCFVCMGNICRSPTAEGVMRHLVKEGGLGHAISIESAGTGGWHKGAPPDARSLAAAARRGYALESRAQQFQREWFARFDYVLAADTDNREDLLALAPDEAARAKIHLLRDFDPASPKGSSVPDPYYGGEHGFEHVLDVVEAACRGLLDEISRSRA